MTPTQHYFPYFFHLDTFNKDIKAFDLFSFVTYNSKTQIPDSLYIARHGSKDSLLTIPFGTTLMVEGDKLFYWTTDYDVIEITQAQLGQLGKSKDLSIEKIDLSTLPLGHSKEGTNLAVNKLVTYVSKEGLKYQQDYYEKFVIVVITSDDINLIPFDSFNKTGGDYGYVWPATARLDPINCKLYGKGMRMSDFTIDLDKACL